jgi:hypothetical protein
MKGTNLAEGITFSDIRSHWYLIVIHYTQLPTKAEINRGEGWLTHLSQEQSAALRKSGSARRPCRKQVRQRGGRWLRRRAAAGWGAGVDGHGRGRDAAAATPWTRGGS